MISSTSMRVSETTLQSMRLATSEIALVRKQWFESDDQRLLALVEYWEATKEEYVAKKQTNEDEEIAHAATN